MLCKEKKSLTQREALLRTAPRWPELSAKRLMPFVAESPLLMAYLPDWKPGQKEGDRDFLWSVIQHVMPKYGSRLMKEALRKRAQLLEAKRKEERPQLNLPPSVVEELLNDEVLHRKLPEQS